MIGGTVATALAGPGSNAVFDRSIKLSGLRPNSFGPQEARQAAEQLVAGALVQPVLAAMRESMQAAGPFAPTDAEKRFGPMLDAAMADNIVHAANFALPKAIADRFTKCTTGGPS